MKSYITIYYLPKADDRNYVISWVEKTYGDDVTLSYSGETKGIEHFACFRVKSISVANEIAKDILIGFKSVIRVEIKKDKDSDYEVFTFPAKR